MLIIALIIGAVVFTIDRTNKNTVVINNGQTNKPSDNTWVVPTTSIKSDSKIVVVTDTGLERELVAGQDVFLKFERTISNSDIPDRTISFSKIAQSGCSANQIIIFNGLNWVCGNMSGIPSITPTVIGSGGTTINVAGTGDNRTISIYNNGTQIASTAFEDLNNYLSAISFNPANGELTLSREGMDALTVDLDGRYLTSGSSANFTNKTGNISMWTNDAGYITGSALAGKVDTSRLINVIGPLQGGGSLANDVTISLPAASATGGGYLSQADWIAFNAGLSGSGISNLNGLIGASQTFATGNSGTSPSFLSSGSTHTLNLPLAGAPGVTAGLISKAQFDTFNNKENAITAGSGAGQYFGGDKAWHNLTAAAIPGIGGMAAQNPANVLITGGSISGTTISGNISMFTNDAGYLTSFVETDPDFALSVAAGILSGDISNWNEAYSWGDHALAGYLTTYVEADPRLPASGSLGNLLRSDGTNWTSWTPNFLTTYNETDPVYTGSVASGITAGDITSWDTAYGWGDHSLAGYLLGSALSATSPLGYNSGTGVFSLNYGSGLYLSGSNLVAGVSPVATGNTLIGLDSGMAMTTGYNNSVFGYNSLTANTTGYGNTVLGANILNNATDADYNIVIGNDAMEFATGGDFNIAIGTIALGDNISGSQNIALGGFALTRNTSGGSNVAIGTNAMEYNTTGAFNTALGAGAGPGAGDSNLSYATALGAGTLVSDSNTTAIGGAGINVAIGISSSYGHRLMVNGDAAMYDLYMYHRTIAPTPSVGDGIIYFDAITEKFKVSESGGAYVDLIGSGSMSLTATNPLAYNSGTSTISLNYGSGLTLDASNNLQAGIIPDGFASKFGNTAIGQNALNTLALSGDGNSAFGNQALTANTFGSYNSAFGSGSLIGNDSGDGNSAFGFQALRNNYNGDYNVAIGDSSLLSNYNGLGNTAVGWSALNNNANGSYNTALGYGAGPDIGSLFGAQPQYRTAIGAGAIVEVDNTIVLGTAADSTAIGDTYSHNYKLWVNGTLGVNDAVADKVGGGSWGVLSDARLKDVQSNFDYGLDEILQLQPIVYKFKTGNALGLDTEPKYSGFLAQEVQKVMPEAVALREDGFLRLEADPILWAMLNAIKELAAERSTDTLGTTQTTTPELTGLTASSIAEINSEKITVTDLFVTGILETAKIKTDLIEAKSEAGLTVKLAGALKESSFKVVSSTGSELFSIRQDGLAKFTGGLEIADNKANASIGNAVIKAGANTITVNTGFAKADSKVFITLTSDVSDPVEPKVVEKGAGYFKVKISNPLTDNVQFDWWVVN